MKKLEVCCGEYGYDAPLAQPQVGGAMLLSPSPDVTRFPFCHEYLVKVQYDQHKSFPVISNTVGQLQDSAMFWKFEVTEI